MKIIIVGCGKVGYTLVEQLSAEGHNIIAIDENMEKLTAVTNNFDVIGIEGNGVSYEILKEADIKGTDLLIAVTGSDEHNLLCCMIAKKAGNCKTIARVRNPIYHNDVEYLKNEFGLAMIINPESALAQEMSQIVRFPFAQKIDSFANGHINLVHFRVDTDSVLVGRSLQDIRLSLKSQMLVCLVNRDGEVTIPRGEFVIQAGDVLGVVAERAKVNTYFKQLAISTTRAKDVIILGGGKTSYYLAKILLKNGQNVKIIEIDRERCEELCERLPKATIIHGDATDHNLLLQEGLEDADVVVSMTNLDEENILLSMFCQSNSNAKTITKVNRVNFSGILDQLSLDSVLYPRLITADYITKFVRSASNSLNNDVENFYKLAEGQAEALEFSVKDDSLVTGTALQQLRIRKNTLICCIYRDGQVIIPSGQDCIMPGDTVVIILKDYKINNLDEILER
ncbi:MAG: Trk system potassium transporter TrkA [Lachnospiraceae bacterium]|nr:Trk system potassium transporter TrkA [Lachnospiraceae bacterium]